MTKKGVESEGRRSLPLDTLASSTVIKYVLYGKLTATAANQLAYFMPAYVFHFAIFFIQAALNARTQTSNHPDSMLSSIYG